MFVATEPVPLFPTTHLYSINEKTDVTFKNGWGKRTDFLVTI